MHNIMMEQYRDPDYPSGRFPTAFLGIMEDFMPDHDMAKIEMEDRLCKIKLGKPDDPQKVLVEITEMQTTFKTS